MDRKNILFVEFRHITAGRHLLPVLTALQNHSNVNVVLLAENNSFLANEAKRLGITTYEASFTEFNIHKPRTYPTTLSLVFLIIRICLRHKIHIIHSHRIDWAYLAIVVAKILKLTVFVDIVFTEKITSNIQRYLLRHSDYCYFVAVSKAAKKEFCSLTQISANKVFVYYGGVDPSYMVSRFSDTLTEQVPAEMKGLFKRKYKIIAMISRVDARKGLDIFIEAAALLAEAYQNVVFVHIGKKHIYSFDEDYHDSGYSYENVCMKKIHSLNLEKRFFLFDYSDSILAYYSLFYCTVLPSWKETLGHVLLESMYFKKPVIATETGGMPETVDKGKAGLLIPFPPTAIHLANAISELLNNKRLYQKLAKTGYQRVTSEFSVNHTIGKLLGYYDKVLVR